MMLSDCKSCGGMWLGRETVERLIASHADDSLVLSLAPGVGATSAAHGASTAHATRIGLEPVRYRKCPECASIMNRVNYARISGIVIDVCRDHGTWFDAQELPALLNFVRRGGLDVARSRETVALADERRRLERERMLRTHVDSRLSDRQSGLSADWNVANDIGVFSLLGDLFSLS